MNMPAIYENTILKTRATWSKPRAIFDEPLLPPSSLVAMLDVNHPEDLVAFDFETTGLDAEDPAQRVVSVGLCSSLDVCYAYQLPTDEHVRAVCEWLSTKKLLAYNYVFDGAWIASYTGQVVAPWVCVYSFYKHMSTEGNATQDWKLGTFIEHMLNWGGSTKDEVREYMKANKCEMHEVIWSVLGPYNAWDAGACYQGYMHLVNELEKHKFRDALWSYLREEMVAELCLVIEQQIDGMPLNQRKLTAFDEDLVRQMDEQFQKILAVPEIAEVMTELRNKARRELMAAEPAKLTKAGTPAAAYARWEKKLAANEVDVPLNFDSPKQLIWLFFERLGYTPIKYTDTGTPSVDKKVIPYLGEAGQLMMKYRKVRDLRKFIVSARESELNGRIHPKLKMVGTVTGRLASGKEG